MKKPNLLKMLKAQLDALRPISPEDEKRIWQKFRLDWNYHSNSIEGNRLTYGETKALLLYNITAEGKPLRDHFEILGHNTAIEWVLEVVKEKRPLTEKFIRELHKVILKEPYEVDAQTSDGKPTKKTIRIGEYKEEPNHVKTRTGEIFYFAEPMEVPALMDELVNWYNDEREDHELDPVLVATSFHYKFVKIHPFDDGNGRTARILMNFILMSYGYPPVIVKTEDKANYISALEMGDAGNLEVFVNYIKSNLKESLEIMIAGAKGEQITDLTDLDKQLFQLDNQLEAIGGVITISQSNQTVLDFFEYNIIRVLKVFYRNMIKFSKYYSATEIALSYGGNDRKTKLLIHDKNIEQISSGSLEQYPEDKLNWFDLSVEYDTFNHKTLRNFSSTYELYFRFEQLRIKLESSVSTKPYVFFYNEIVDTQLIEKLIKEFTETHIREINRYLTDFNS